LLVEVVVVETTFQPTVVRVAVEQVAIDHQLQESHQVVVPQQNHLRFFN
jgi:hypothetical protein